MSTAAFVDLTFDDAGTVACVYEDSERVLGTDVDLVTGLGDIETRRASHVEPDGKGGWYADMAPMGGPRLDGFKLRSDALFAEREWLREERGL